MIELRWLESETHVVNGESFAHPVTIRTLQYRVVQHETCRLVVGNEVHAGFLRTTTNAWGEWQDVPAETTP